MADLTNKQRVFVEEYLRCWNASEATRLAGYKFPNVEGSRLLANASISQLVEQRLKDKAMAADEVLARLTDHARNDIRHFLNTDDDGVVIGFNLAPDKPLHLIKEATITETIERGTTKRTFKLGLYDAQAALVHLGRHHGLFVDKTALTDPTGQHEYSAAQESLTRKLDQLATALTPTVSDQPHTDGA